LPSSILSIILCYQTLGCFCFNNQLSFEKCVRKKINYLYELSFMLFLLDGQRSTVSLFAQITSFTQNLRIVMLGIIFFSFSAWKYCLLCFLREVLGLQPIWVMIMKVYKCPVPTYVQRFPKDQKPTSERHICCNE
jgi:hypothetical protein